MEKRRNGERMDRKIVWKGGRKERRKDIHADPGVGGLQKEQHRTQMQQGKKKPKGESESGEFGRIE